ncbi:SLBB domain-containing protein [Gloeobacter kilaueensis]|uniref:Polysaccharide export protein n=1 Tax=Gloeobacter kilaueensis (strain ATCC BAA-2537 / CCAP 1431/1 / ULC 316 / JS1) TaxID=1183438 RepID=U5QID0_GLOK1|nr:SLBB domain-containing protein [Gloeobacter kilaueensis]AGY58648.1 polysaccharide export protein [Gloeobacter kilaueensis JS1]
MKHPARLGLLLALALFGPLPERGLAAGEPVPTLSTGLVNQGYRLRSGDRIHVDVVDFPDLSKDQLILPDGTINVLYLGAVQAAGRTPEQLSSELSGRFQGILRQPVISVSVIGTRPLKVNVIGEVLNPGPQSFRVQNQLNAAIQPNTGGNGVQSQETISGALSLAGGVTPLADMRRVSLIRQGPDGPTEKTIDLWQALQSGDFSQDLSLTDGDTVKVARLEEGDAAGEQMAATLATTTFAPETVKVQVAGEVKKPGLVNADPRSSLLNTIYEAGGPTTEADLSSVNVARMMPSGKLQRLHVDVSAIAEGKVAFQVRNGDIVFIGRQGSRQFADDIRAFLGPIGGLLNLVFPFGYLFGR